MIELLLFTAATAAETGLSWDDKLTGYLYLSDYSLNSSPSLNSSFCCYSF